MTQTQPPAFTRLPHVDSDLQLLLDRFSSGGRDGRLITHEQVEQTLHVRRDSAHYRNMTRHWRRALMRDQGVYLDGRSARGQGFIVLTGDGHVRFGHRSLSSAGRQTKRALVVLSAPPDEEILDPSTRIWRARTVAAFETIAHNYGHTLRSLSAALRAPKQIRTISP